MFQPLMMIIETHIDHMKRLNLPNPWQYSKRQTRAQEIEKCLDEALEPIYHFSIFNTNIPVVADILYINRSIF